MRTMKRRINKVAPKARMREAVRSEYVRDRWVARTFALRVAQLTGLGDDIFFLTIEEVLNVLSGDEAVVKFIPARKDIHRRYSSLPTRRLYVVALIRSGGRQIPSGAMTSTMLMAPPPVPRMIPMSRRVML